MRLKPVPTITSDTTYGTNTRTRITERPRMRRLSMSATTTATGPWSTSDMMTMNALCPSAARNSGSRKMMR